MAADLTSPRRLHPLTLVLGPVRILQGWAVPIVVALVLGRSDRGAFAGVGVVALVVGATVVRQVLEFLRLRWWVADGAFQMRSGILQTEVRSVPIDRVQNVDVTQPLLPRLLGIADVRIETAGAGGGDISLRSVSMDEAYAIRAALAQARVLESGEESPVQRTLLEVGTGELLIAGATANRIGAIAVLLGAAWGWVADLGLDPGDLIDEAEVFAGRFRVSLLVAAAVVLAVIVGWVVSIVATILRYHGFKLTEDGGDLRREHGLLTRATGVIPIARVQAVRIERPILRRLTRRASVVADSAGSVAASTDTGSGVVAPILRDGDVPSIVRRVLQTPDVAESPLASVNRLAIRRGFLRIAVFVVLISTAAALVEFGYGLVLVPGLACAWLWAKARYRAIGYRVDQNLVVARSGVLTRRTWLVPTSKVQSTVVRTSPFQRRLGLATLSLDTAGPGNHRVSVIDLDAPLAREMAVRLSGLSSQHGMASDGV